MTDIVPLEIVGVDDDDEIVFTDAGGEGAIPIRVLHVLAHSASQRDTARAKWGRRYVARDTLVALRDYVDNLDRCGACNDAPGTHDMDDGRRFCAACCSAAVSYDDREEPA